MSGGAFNYLSCISEPVEYFNRLNDLDDMKKYLLQEKCKDVAEDIETLISYIEASLGAVQILSERLQPVFHAAEWYESGDSGEDDLKQAIEKYRCENYKN